MNDLRTLLNSLNYAKKKGEPHKIIQALTDLANYYRDEKEWDKLQQVVEERHQLQTCNGAPAHGLLYLARDLAENNMGDRALKLLERARKEFSELKMYEHSFEWENFYNAQVEVFLSLNKLDDAIESCRKVVDIAKSRAAEYSDYWEMHNYLADLIEYKKCDAKSALVERELLWHHFRRSLDKYNQLSYNAICVHIPNGVRLANIYRNEKQPENAIPIYEQLVKDVESSEFFGKDSIEVPTLQILLAECYLESCNSQASNRYATSAKEWFDAHEAGDAGLSERLDALLKT